MNNDQLNNNMNNTIITPNTTPVIVKKSSGGAVVAIIILSFLLTCAIGYIYYSKVYVEKEEKTISTKEALDSTKVDVNGLYQVEDTMKTFENAFNYYDSKYFGYIYNKDEITSSDFDNGAALFASIFNKYENAPVVSYVSNNEVKNEFKNIFGNSKDYKPSNIIVNDKFTISYDSEKKYYSALNVGKGGYFYPTYFSNVESTKVSDNYVKVVRNIGYIEYVNNTSINVFAADGKNNLVKNVKLKEGSFNPDELIAKYKSKLSQFTYTFKIDGDKYTFEKIERTK